MRRYFAIAAMGAVLISMVAAVFTLACDTWVALPDTTADGAATILAKNSDRPLFDAQPLVWSKGGTWPEGSEIDLGRITIPQTGTTYTTLGSQPYWCWGYEEGINEHGVAIGNEGVWTRPLMDNLRSLQAGQSPELGPTGMDLVRLGLERGRTAHEALIAITQVLEAFGQFGSGAPTVPALNGSYDNTFLIADSTEAWILETAGRQWVARRITSGSASISNDLTIGDAYDLASEDLIGLAEEKGWWDPSAGDPFSFRDAYRDDSPIGSGRTERAICRTETSARMLADRAGSIDTVWMMTIARDRSSSPAIDQDATASSCVAVLPTDPSTTTVFWWAPARPSVSCYVPFFVQGQGVPDGVSRAGTYPGGVMPPSEVEPDAYAEGSYWWAFRDLADLATGGVLDETARVRAVFDPLEQEFDVGLPDIVLEADRLRSEGRDDEAAEALSEYSSLCASRALAAAEELRTQLRQEQDAQEIPAHLLPYLGTYHATFNDSIYTVSVRGGHLALDVPGQTVYELNDPNESGLWSFALSAALAVSFGFAEDGSAVSLILHQDGLALEFLREGYTPSIEIPASQAEAYLGIYRHSEAGQTQILYQNGRLAVRLDDMMIFELRESTDDGRWVARATEQLSIRFETGSSGGVTGLRLARGSQITSYARELPITEVAQPSETDSPAQAWSRSWMVLIVLALIVAGVLSILP